MRTSTPSAARASGSRRRRAHAGADRGAAFQQDDAGLARLAGGPHGGGQAAGQFAGDLDPDQPGPDHHGGPVRPAPSARALSPATLRAEPGDKPCAESRDMPRQPLGAWPSFDVECVLGEARHRRPPQVLPAASTSRS